MKRLLLLAVLGGLSLTAPAQTGPDSSVRIHGYQIDLPARPHTLYKGDFDEYKGSYSLSNGDILTLVQRGRRIYGSVGDGSQKELVAAAKNVFVALDREMKVTLNKDDWGDYSGELLFVRPDASRQASVLQAYTLVASR